MIRIHEPTYVFDDKKANVDIEIRINPGPRFEFSYKEYKNEDKKGKKIGYESFLRLNALKEATNAGAMTSLNKEDIDLLAQRVVRYYKNLGFYYVRVTGTYVDELDSSRMIEGLYSKFKNIKFTLKSFKDEVKNATEYVVSMPGELKDMVTGKKKQNLKILRTVKFDIFMKNQIVVGKISVHGNKLIPNKKVLSIIESAADFETGEAFSKEHLDEGLINLEGFYNESGYLRFDVTDIDYTFRKKKIVENVSDEVEKSKGKTPKHILEADVDIFIKEGAKTLIEDIAVTGNHSFARGDLLEIAGIKERDIYSLDEVENAAAAIKNYYKAHGFYYFKFSNPNFATFNSDYSSVKIRFDISEGEIIHVGSIILKGNHRTKSRVVVRKMDLKEGGILSSDKILNTEEYLLRLGLFSNVKIETIGDVYIRNKTNYHDMLIEMKEANFKSVKFGIGYNTDEKFRTFLSYQHNNIGGAGRQGRARFKTNRRTKVEKFAKLKYEEDEVGFLGI